MGMGFAPTWLRHVSHLLHMTTLTTACALGKGVCDGAKIFAYALLQPTRTLCVYGGVCGWAKFLAPPYYSQPAVFASLWALFMRPSSLGGGRILRRTLSVRLSVCLSVRLSVRPSVPLLLPSVTWRHLANYNDTHVLFGTHWGPHIVRPSRPHKFLFSLKFSFSSTKTF